ncbi:hypothetical protein [Rhodothermus marinus]|uniref:hypothetical protein n=1 Tax=Rhodothermus marinus TaxID=29549 RepID=UPI001FB2508D|nr:hypothetical protein [Rhodothermus marinus]
MMRKPLLKILIGALGLLLVLIVVLLVRAWRVGQQVESTENLEPLAVSLDAEALAQRLAGALRFPTVSNQDPARIDSGAFGPSTPTWKRIFPGYTPISVGRSSVG